jgi:hypothetical protein
MQLRDEGRRVPLQQYAAGVEYNVADHESGDGFID